jgi:hypothetical protein
MRLMASGHSMATSICPGISPDGYDYFAGGWVHARRRKLLIVQNLQLVGNLRTPLPA